MEQPTRSLSPQKLLDVWEAGRQQHELDRALTLLAAAHPELRRDELADLTIGERDMQLLRLRMAHVRRICGWKFRMSTMRGAR